MKLIHSVALVAAVLLISETIASSDAASVDWWPKFGGGNDKEKDNLKEEEIVPKASALQQGQKDEEGGAPIASDPMAAVPLDEEDYNDDAKARIAIPDEGEEIRTINTLPEPGQTTFYQPQTRPAPANQSYDYDRNAQQSPFVDNAPHPTQSQGPDPRFSRPRQCQDGQYLCRKATPQQDHLRCIPNEWKCNGVRDCEENDDEEGCAVNNYQPRPVAQCDPSQYTCYGSGVNGLPAQCIDRSKICNQVYDCSYGDDEDNDRCAEYAVRRPPTDIPQPQPQQPPVQNAPPVYQPPPQPAPRQPEPQPPQQCPETRSDEQFKRLEWTDRCIRSCLSNNRH